jgi:hypothetical protein
MFNFFKLRDAQQWQRDLISIMAKLAVNYNSYYSQTYSFTDLLSKRPRKLNVFTQFFPPRVRFRQTFMPVTIWYAKAELLPKLEVETFEVMTSKENQNKEWVEIYIPEVLKDTFSILQNKLLKAYDSYGPEQINQETVSGVLTSSGRTFWLPSMKRGPIGFKIDTLDIKTVTPFLNSRRLDPGHVRLALLVTKHLGKTAFSNFFNEEEGLHIQASAESQRYVALERSLDFDATGVQNGDFLVPMQAIASGGFWEEPGNLKIFGLENTNQAKFFNEQLVRGFAELIKNSLEETFFHFEVHQQNLTCHIREGVLQRILVHDLQDVIFDPTCYLLSALPDGWHERLAFISEVYRSRFFNFYGEARLNIENHRHYFTPSTFYRRYFRNFGNYTRIYNRACNEDYLFSRKMEELLVSELNYSESELGLTKKIKSHPNFPLLSKNPFWIIDRRIAAQQQIFMQKIFSSLNAEAQKLSESEIENLIKRLPLEVGVCSANMQLLNPKNNEIVAAYRVYKDHVYFLKVKNDEFVSVIFFPTMGY